MQIIHFENKETLCVPDEIATIIRDKIIRPEGSPLWQTFSNEQDKLFLMLNMDKVCFIENPEMIKEITAQ